MSMSQTLAIVTAIAATTVGSEVQQQVLIWLAVGLAFYGHRLDRLLGDRATTDS